MKILRMGETARIDTPCGVGFECSPMNYEMKQEIAKCMNFKSGQAVEDTQKILFLAAKFSIKKLHGVNNCDGSEYKLEFEDYSGQEVLTNQCAIEILTMDIPEMPLIMSKLAQSIPNRIVNPITGEELEGVKVIFPETKVKKSKRQ